MLTGAAPMRLAYSWPQLMRHACVIVCHVMAVSRDVELLSASAQHPCHAPVHAMNLYVSGQ